MRPIQTILVLEDLRNSFSGPLHRKGIGLSTDDSQTVIDVYQQWILLMTDLGYLHPRTLLRVAQRLLTDMVKADVLELNNAFAELLNLVRLQDNKGFKALCSKISPHLYPLVKGDMELYLQGDVYAARRLTQAFAFTLRLSLKDIDLTQQCLDDYVRIEDNIPDSFPDHLVQALNKIIRRWMKPFDPANIHCQHGPGGVAGLGRTSLQSKYKDLTYDQKLIYAYGPPVWSTGLIRSSLDRISQTIFVPKSYKTFRTISMESSTLQYCQQGVWGEIDRVVAESRYLKRRIGFHEQERNQLLAKEGSVNRNYATIDLSAASDSVGYELVKRLFRGTRLLRFIVTTRSSRTLLPDGRVINLRKFAPMGSALCFPIETIIFASICELVTREHRVSGKYSVFGDDIIVPTTCVERVLNILSTLGFTVNPDKSYVDPCNWFRESCGAEFCNGFDVTPMRVSREYAHVEDVVRITAAIDLANEAYTRGFRNLRQFYIERIKKSKWVPFFSPTELLSDNYTNYHTVRDWDSDIQSIQCRVTTIGVKYKLKTWDETIRLRHWFESTHGRLFRVHGRITYYDGFVSETRYPTVTLKSGWRNKPYEEPDQPFITYCLQSVRNK